MRSARKALRCLVWSLVLAGALSGCNSEDARHLKDDTRNLAEHTGEALGSARLAGSVSTVLALRKGVDMSGLHIEAKDGVVTLSGHVRNRQEKHRVLDTVNGIRGVDKVIDHLRIEPPH